MHASVVKAKEHRDRENGRRRHNAKKFQSQTIMRLFGLEPAFTPSPTGTNHKIRRVESQPERNRIREEKLVTQFFLNWIMLNTTRTK